MRKLDKLYEYTDRIDNTDDYVYYEVEEVTSRIALCTLSAINWGNIKKPEDFEKPCDLAVRALDALLSYQEYPKIEAELATDEFRTLGVGLINLAYFLAKNNMKYDNEGANLVNEYMEAMSYYLIKASVKLAEEYGSCSLSQESKYGRGVFPHEVRKKNVDQLIDTELKMDWESLREDMLKYGIRNAAVMAAMPSESSSQLANATNGVEPPRALVSEKSSKDGALTQVVPEYHKLKNKYDLLWDQETPKGYLTVMAAIQKFTDQSISANTSYNPENFPGGKIPLQTLIGDIFFAYKYGMKNLYYSNTHDQAGEVNLDDEEACDSCTL